jgi:hypothetical protein
MSAGSDWIWPPVKYYTGERAGNSWVMWHCSNNYTTQGVPKTSAARTEVDGTDVAGEWIDIKLPTPIISDGISLGFLNNEGIYTEHWDDIEPKDIYVLGRKLGTANSSEVPWTTIYRFENLGQNYGRISGEVGYNQINIMLNNSIYSQLQAKLSLGGSDSIPLSNVNQDKENVSRQIFNALIGKTNDNAYRKGKSIEKTRQRVNDMIVSQQSNQRYIITNYDGSYNSATNKLVDKKGTNKGTPNGGSLSENQYNNPEINNRYDSEVGTSIKNYITTPFTIIPIIYFWIIILIF